VQPVARRQREPVFAEASLQAPYYWRPARWLWASLPLGADSLVRVAVLVLVVVPVRMSFSAGASAWVLAHPWLPLPWPFQRRPASALSRQRTLPRRRPLSMVANQLREAPQTIQFQPSVVQMPAAQRCNRQRAAQS